MNQDDRKRGLEWAKQELAKRQHTFEVPDRQIGEEPLTAKQLAYIQQLANNIELEKVQSLGKWQASALIDHLIAVRDRESTELGEQWAQMQQGTKKGGGNWIVMIVVAVLVVFVLFALLGR
jgi:hypothetical protein